jgi:cyclic pyranopterin phosphate synthase
MVTFPHLETNITTYCQNKCVSCNHIIPLVTEPAHLSPEIIERDLTAARQFMHACDYTLVGGEPTLHPEIMDIIGIVKRSGIADGMVVYTNGQAMRHLSDAFYREVNQLIVTPYKLSDDDRAYIMAKCTEFGTQLEWHWVGFTRTFYRHAQPKASADNTYGSCWFRWNRKTVDNGYFYRCCISPFIPTLLGKTPSADGLALDGMTDETLKAYLNQETPEVCYYCTSNVGPQIGWRETTREKWLEESLG